MPSRVPHLWKLRHEHLPVRTSSWISARRLLDIVFRAANLLPLLIASACLCRDRSTRTLLGFLPILGKGYTTAETETDSFRDRSYEVIQQGLEIVSNCYDI